jgi:predicted transcriptional regulator
MPNLGATYRHVLDEARRRFSEGETIEAIATELEMSASIVAKYTAHLPQPSQFGGHGRVRAKKRETRRRAILGCLDAGLDVRATAKEVGCKISQVVRFIHSERAEEQSRVEKKREEFAAALAAEKKRAADEAKAAEETQAEPASPST